MTVLSEAYKAARAQRKEHTAVPILVFIGRFLGTYLPSPRQLRRTILSLGGFAFLDYAAWQLHTIAGLAAVGLTLLILEALSNEGDR